MKFVFEYLLLILMKCTLFKHEIYRIKLIIADAWKYVYRFSIIYPSHKQNHVHYKKKNHV